MRQGQQNRRGRGRGNHNQGHSGGHSGSGNSSGGNNNNRKAQNLLSKNYESSGPDVKIRGTAQHIAEKYMHLARDAMSSGDLVTAENYLQHAEHYNRIIAAAQAAHAQQYAGQPHAPQPYLPDNVNGASGSGGGRSQPHGGHQPDVADHGADTPAVVAVANGSDETPVMRPDAEQPVVVEAAGEQQPNSRHRGRRRRPAGGPEGRLNANGAAVPAKAEPEDMAG